MFDQIVIRRHELRGSQIDAGAFAEALLFYGNVHLLMDGAVLTALLKSIGVDVLQTLLEQRRVTATWLTDHLGVITNTRGLFSYHEFSAFKIEREASGKRVRDKDAIVKIFVQTLGASSATRRAAAKLIDHLEFRANEPVRRLPNGTVVAIDEHGLTAQARTDVSDSVYLRRVVEATLDSAVPTYTLPADWYFDLVRTPDGFVSATNLNFDAINREYHKLVDEREDSLTPAGILVRALTARADLNFAADYMSEFLTDPLTSKLIRLRMNELLKRRGSSSTAIEAFQEAELRDGRAIRETINSGERSFDEFLTLLDRSQKFKDWLKGQNPDVNLLAEYYRAVVKDSWIDRLPPKAVRFVLFALGGVALEHLIPSGLGVASGVGLGLGDVLLLEKVLKGWRPNHFVEGPLRRFVNND